MLESHLHEKRPWHRCFAVNFAKFLRTPFVTENLRVTASKCHQNYILTLSRLGALTTFFLVNGAFNGAFDIYRYERGCKDFKNYRSNLNELKRLHELLINLRKEVNNMWVPCK